MAGTINSLGLGSGVLTADVIDKLKANDVANVINPITRKITLEQQKGSAYNLLNSLLTTFKSSASALSDSSLFQQRSVSGSNNAVSVTADAGVALQSFSISDTRLALQNVKESGAFTLPTDKIAGATPGTMALAVNGLTYNISYTSATTLDDLKNSINASAGSSVKASVLQVGATDYRLVLTSVNTGANQTITLTDSVPGSLDSRLLPYVPIDPLNPLNPSNPTGMQEIQAAGDASFKYNGITLTRSTNTITDITPGMTINLLQKDTVSIANISITQNAKAVSDEVNNFVQNYNALRSQLNDMTTSNIDTGKIGIFNGDNSINAISSQINKIFTSVSSSGLSLPQYGIDLDEKGVMSFNSAAFNTKFNQDPTGTEAFFTNSTTGVFTSMNTLMDSYTGLNGIMTALTTGSTNELKSLNENKTRSQAMLDARYATMSARFAAYDSMISRLNSQFSSLQQQISASMSGK